MLDPERQALAPVDHRERYRNLGIAAMTTGGSGLIFSDLGWIRMFSGVFCFLLGGVFLLRAFKAEWFLYEGTEDVQGDSAGVLQKISIPPRRKFKTWVFCLGVAVAASSIASLTFYRAFRGKSSSAVVSFKGGGDNNTNGQPHAGRDDLGKQASVSKQNSGSQSPERSKKAAQSDKDVQDIRLEFMHPPDPQISVRNTGSGLVREPRYNLTLASLDTARWDDKGVLPVLRTYQPSFSQSEWLRPGQGLGGFALFDSATRPPENSRLLGWVSCTCPQCMTERTYLVFVVFGKSGWYYEVPQGRSIDRQWFNSLFGKSEEEQQQLLDAGIPENKRIPFAP